MDSPEAPLPSRSRAVMRRLPILVILLAAVIGTVLLRDQIDFSVLRAHHDTLMGLRDAHYALTVLGFMVAYVLIVTLSLPGAALSTVTGGFLFGVFPGVVYTVVAATIGAVAVFLAARIGFGDRLAARIDAGQGRVKRLSTALRENEWEVLFIMRLIPVVPFFVGNLVPAMIGVRTHRFFVTTLLGIIPGGLVYTSVGNGLGEILARGEQPDMGVIFEPHILLPILGLAALAALPILIRSMRRRVP